MISVFVPDKTVDEISEDEIVIPPKEDGLVIVGRSFQVHRGVPPVSTQTKRKSLSFIKRNQE